MSAIIGFDAAKALIAEKLVPPQTYEFTINVTTNGLVELTTKSYLTPEDWEKVAKIAVQAKEAAKLRQTRHRFC
jgi:hypothetical protein